MQRTPSSQWPTTQSDLMELLRGEEGRDEEGWARFFRSYQPLILNYARSLGLQHADAEAVVSTVLLRMLRFVYDPEKGRFRDWLGVVIRNEVRSVLARAGAPVQFGPDVPTEPESADADPDWDRAFQDRVLELAMGRVSQEFRPEDWAAFRRTAIEGRPCAEVARELFGGNTGRVYKARHRVVTRLREEVARLSEAPFAPTGP